MINKNWYYFDEEIRKSLKNLQYHHVPAVLLFLLIHFYIRGKNFVSLSYFGLFGKHNAMQPTYAKPYHNSIGIYFQPVNIGGQCKVDVYII